jgi:hypothetical protein
MHVEENVLSTDLLHVHDFKVWRCPVINYSFRLFGNFLRCPDLVLGVLQLLLGLLLFYALLSRSTSSSPIECFNFHLRVGLCNLFLLFAMKRCRRKGRPENMRGVFFLFPYKLLEGKNVNARPVCVHF